jgi:two-component system LytT family response regulator
MTDRKVILADDEEPSRNLLKEYLRDYPSLQIAAECRNGVEAVAVINVLQPDIVFLDIQMPGKTGFEVLKEIEHIPQVIFSTAYDQYAIQAFEVNAIDYLLKPYTKERFAAAINKILSQETVGLQNIKLLTESLLHKFFPERILVEQGNKLVSLPVTDIIWLEAHSDYTKIHTMKQSFLSNKGISELEKKLNPQQFQRIHRSAIISLHAIAEVHKEINGPQIVLTNGITLKVSRSYTDALKKLIY